MRILIVEGQALCRHGLAAMIEARTAWTVAGAASSGREGLKLAAELQPDITVVGLMLDELNGIDLAHRLRSQSVPTKIILLTRFGDSGTYQRAVEAGVHAFLLKRDGFDLLQDAVRAVVRGRHFVSPSVEGLNPVVGRQRSGPAASPELTLREREVIQLVAEGHLAKEIAHDLGLSVKSVESYRRRIMEKLRLNNVSDLTRFALREGLVRLEGAVLTQQGPGADSSNGEGP